MKTSAAVFHGFFEIGKVDTAAEDLSLAVWAHSIPINIKSSSLDSRYILSIVSRQTVLVKPYLSGLSTRTRIHSDFWRGLFCGTSSCDADHP